MSEAICGKEGAYRYTWPGRDEAYICESHSVMLRNVSAAMGLRLQLIPVPSEAGVCQQKVGKDED